MSELPSGWTSTSFGEITTPRGEKAAPSTLGDAPFVGMDHIEAQTSRLLATQPVSELKSAVSVFKTGDILYGRLRPYLNKVHEAEFDGAASAEFIVIPPSPAIEQRYLAYRMRSPDFVSLANQRSTGDRPRVTFESLSDFTIALPPLPEQRRIVAKIDNLSARSGRARDHLDHIHWLVERYKQAVLDSVFVSLPSHVPLQHQVIAERGIPYGIVQTGEPFDGGIPTVRCGDIKGFGVNREGLKLVDPNIEAEYRRTRLQGGEVLLAIRGSVGETCVVPPELIGCNISREVAMIPVREGVEPDFIMYFLASSTAKRFILGNVKGVAQQGINLRDLKELPAPSCSLAKQKEVVQRIRSAFAWIDRLASEARRARKLLAHLDQAILAKAFRGELVSQDCNDEPASALLKRIRIERATAAPAKGDKKRDTKPVG